MIQRKCGTCRYFEEGGIAASGWCRHPERQDLQHMVLVRKTELACRDGWDHDLWEPVDAGGPGPRPMTPAMAGAGSNQADPVPSNGSRGPNHGTGEGHPGRSDERDGFSPANRSERPHSVAGESEPSGNEFKSRRHQEPTDAWSSGPGEQTGDAQLDEVQGETFSTRGLRPDAGWRRQLSELRQHTTHSHELVPRPPMLEREEDTDPRQSVTRSEHESHGHTIAEPEFGASNWGVQERSLDANRPSDRYDEGPVQQSGLTEPFDFAAAGEQATGPVPDDTSAYQEPVEQLPDETEDFEEDDDLASPENNGSTALPTAITETQCCRTCRDFIPADGGKRGWCSNTFAFDKRQQVEGDDVACRGTYGDWWSPSDDWWIERADISHHSTPTPLVEELIRELRDRAARQQGSTGKPQRS